MERITLKSYLRDKAMDRDVDTDTDTELESDAADGVRKPSSRWHRVNGQAMPASAKVTPKWIVIRRNKGKQTEG